MEQFLQERPELNNHVTGLKEDIADLIKVLSEKLTVDGDAEAAIDEEVSRIVFMELFLFFGVLLSLLSIIHEIAKIKKMNFTVCHIRMKVTLIAKFWEYIEPEIHLVLLQRYFSSS